MVLELIETVHMDSDLLRFNFFHQDLELRKFSIILRRNKIGLSSSKYLSPKISTYLSMRHEDF